MLGCQHHAFAGRAWVMATRKILIVDDDQDGAATLGLLLEMWGHEPTVRYDARSAMELLEQFRPEVAFVDLSMPIVTGYDLCRHIRRQPWGEDTFVFALTGWMHTERDALAAGFDGCLLKPCSLDQLKDLLDHPLARSHRPRELRRGPRGVVPRKPGNTEQA